MKKLFLAMAMAMTTALSFASNENPTVEVANGNDPSINKATAAIKANCPNAQGQLSYSTEVVSACFVDGFITKVTFWSTPNCPPNQICIQIVELVGTVTLDCEGNVMSVECGAAAF